APVGTFGRTEPPPSLEDTLRPRVVLAVGDEDDPHLRPGGEGTLDETGGGQRLVIGGGGGGQHPAPGGGIEHPVPDRHRQLPSTLNGANARSAAGAQRSAIRSSSEPEAR